MRVLPESRTLKTENRRGAILLIVLVLLALFAVVGLAFVLFSQAEAQNSRIVKDGMNNPGEVPDPQAALNDFLRQMVYSSNDNNASVASAMRGYDLTRLAYGYNSKTTNSVPYSGMGLFSEIVTLGTAGAMDRRDVINYTAINSTDTVLDPEYTGSRLASAPTPITAVFVPKNAAYTYPDRNNACVAMMDPESGRVTVPSFHRPELFADATVKALKPLTTTAQPFLMSMHPSNTNWTNAAGRYKILRPRPIDHQYDSGDGRGFVSDFPYPPPNPDGTYTGDVQNLRYGNNIQFNDAVWIHANLPVVKYRGRDLQPLVAVTMVPLDGRVNFNVSGNHRDSGNGHASNQGFGPYEINPQAVLVPAGTMGAGVPPPNEAQELIKYRYGSTYRPASAPGALAVTTTIFDPSIPSAAYADYSPVNYDAFNAPYPVPTQPNGLRTEPFYTTTAGYDNNLTSSRHQSLFNPYFLNDSPATGGRTLRLFDLRQTAYRYSGIKARYAPPLFGFTQTNSSFTGVGPNHPSNKTRALTTTISNSLNRSGVMPNFFAIAPTNYMQQPASPGLPAAPAASPQSFTATALPTASADTVPNQGYRSRAAALGPIDLNRPLADYRSLKTVPLSNPANLAAMAGTAPQAARDRQDFAKEIFDRLVLATGAQCDAYDARTGRPVGFTSVTPGTPAFDALRYLAQLSVNIVDFVDIDDVNTAFVWNPTNLANPTPEQDQANFNPADMGNRTVFGVEKTRLVLNEVYSEVTNDPNDATQPSANSDFQVRFFIELLNPLNANKNHPGPNATNTSPFGTGAAMLRNTSTNASVYRVEVYDDANGLRNQLFGATSAINVTGTPTGLTPRCRADMPQSAQPVEPNDNNNSNTGFRMLCPAPAVTHSDSDMVVYHPVPTGNPVPTQVLQVPSGGGTNRLTYTVTKQRPNDIPTNTMNQLNTGGTTAKHAVLLQRLANPYIAAGPTNPFITVDSMFDVRVNDAIRVGEQVGPPPIPPTPGTRNNPPDPNQNAQRSHGRRAPMYAYRGATPQASYAIDQQRSLLTHNNNKFGQFEWLTHHDRKLINPLEVLQVAAVKPHELLHYFVTSQNGQMDPVVQPSQKHHHTSNWYQPQTNLARGLELLGVKPWMYGIPLGGRQPGRMNANMIWHKDALTALLDPKQGNGFTQAQVDALWSSLFNGFSNPTFTGRTRTFPDIGNTFDEAGAGDRPFQSFGVANYAPAPTGALPAGHTVDESLFRLGTTGAPMTYINAGPTSTAHPMAQAELLRKASNNLTTTTDTYMMVFTIGYFEVRAPATATRYIPYLGREAFNEIPGDLRVQYAAIVDRSMVAVSPDPALAGQQAPNVFFTELSDNFDPLAGGTLTLRFRSTGTGAASGGPSIRIDYEGRAMSITRNASVGSSEVNTLVIGTGSEAIYVKIPPNATLTPPTGNNGIGQITFPPGTFQPMIPQTNTVLAANQLRKYFAGEAVGSAVLGNPGPQPNFDPKAPQYTQVVRDLIKLTP